MQVTNWRKKNTIPKILVNDCMGDTPREVSWEFLHGSKWWRPHQWICRGTNYEWWRKNKFCKHIECERWRTKSRRFCCELFKKLWHVVKEDVVMDFFKPNHIVKTINRSHTIGISKIQNATNVPDLRPIGSCNSTYDSYSKLWLGEWRIYLVASFRQTRCLPS